MPFAFTKKKIVRRKVVIKEPVDMVTPEDTGVREGVLWVTWEILPTDDKNGMGNYDRAHFVKVTSKVEGAVDEENKPLEVSKELLAEMLTWDYFYNSFLREYLNCTVAAGRGN